MQEEKRCHAEAINKLLQALPHLAPNFEAWVVRFRSEHKPGHTVNWNDPSDPFVSSLINREEKLTYLSYLCALFSDYYAKEMAERSYVTDAMKNFDLKATLHPYVDQPVHLSTATQDHLEQEVWCPLIETSLETGIYLASASNLLKLRSCIEKPYLNDMVQSLIALTHEVVQAFPNGVPLYYKQTLESFIGPLRDHIFELKEDIWRDRPALDKKTYIMQLFIKTLLMDWMREMAPCVREEDIPPPYLKLFANQDIYLEMYTDLFRKWRDFKQDPRRLKQPCSPCLLLDKVLPGLRYQTMDRPVARIYGRLQVLALLGNILLFVACPPILCGVLIRYYYLSHVHPTQNIPIFWLPKTKMARQAEQCLHDFEQLHPIFERYSQDKPEDKKVALPAMAISL